MTTSLHSSHEQHSLPKQVIKVFIYIATRNIVLHTHARIQVREAALPCSQPPTLLLLSPEQFNQVTMHAAGKADQPSALSPRQAGRCLLGEGGTTQYARRGGKLDVLIRVNCKRSSSESSSSYREETRASKTNQGSGWRCARCMQAALRRRDRIRVARI